jgi:hypothetical protein
MLPSTAPPPAQQYDKTAPVLPVEQFLFMLRFEHSDKLDELGIYIGSFEQKTSEFVLS